MENGGIATRDFIYVGDIVEGLIACAHARRAGRASTTWRAACETSIRELAELINELTGNPTPDRAGPGARLGPLRPALRQHRQGARASWASQPGSTLREGLERTIAWTRENLDWIERCIARHRERIEELSRRAGGMRWPLPRRG